MSLTQAAELPFTAQHSAATVDAPRKLITTREAAERYGYSTSFLAHARVRGDGPPYIKARRSVRYDVATVDAWFAAQRVGSTSEADRRAGR